MKEHLRNETPSSDQSATDSYLKEINILKEELNKNTKEFIERIRNLTAIT